MQTHLFILALELLLLLLLINCDVAFSTHTTCSWRPGNGVPKDNKFYSFCPANLDDGGVYDCRDSIFRNKKGLQVASYGRTARDVFEWLSPCGDGGGYGLKEDGNCISDFWGMCVTEDTKDCLYMAAYDSCQWPHTITNPSRMVYVFFYSNATAQEQQE